MSKETFCVWIENGKVVNITVIAKDSPLLAEHPEWIFIDDNPQKICIGWGYDGVNFIAPPPLPRPLESEITQ